MPTSSSSTLPEWLQAFKDLKRKNAEIMRQALAFIIPARTAAGQIWRRRKFLVAMGVPI